MCPPFEDDAKQSARGFPPSTDSPEFSPEERHALLSLAHAAISAEMEHRQLCLTPPSPHLAEPRGVFTTLYHGHALRGCVGYVVPTTSLYAAVAETARAAAFDDVRFPALLGEEIPKLAVSLSILSALQPIRPEEIQIGRHGLLIRLGGRRGLLLPQVPLEHGWDRTTFLEQTCRKAGLASTAWQTGASLEAFTAEVFGD